MTEHAVVFEEGQGHVCAANLSFQHGINRYTGRRLTSDYPSLTIWWYH